MPTLHLASLVILSAGSSLTKQLLPDGFYVYGSNMNKKQKDIATVKRICCCHHESQSFITANLFIFCMFCNIKQPNEYESYAALNILWLDGIKQNKQVTFVIQESSWKHVVYMMSFNCVHESKTKNSNLYMGTSFILVICSSLDFVYKYCLTAWLGYVLERIWMLLLAQNDPCKSI